MFIGLGLSLSQPTRAAAGAADGNTFLLSGDAQTGTDTLLLSPTSATDSLELSGTP